MGHLSERSGRGRGRARHTAPGKRHTRRTKTANDGTVENNRVKVETRFAHHVAIADDGCGRIGCHVQRRPARTIRNHECRQDKRLPAHTDHRQHTSGSSPKDSTIAAKDRATTRYLLQQMQHGVIVEHCGRLVVKEPLLCSFQRHAERLRDEQVVSTWPVLVSSSVRLPQPLALKMLRGEGWGDIPTDTGQTAEMTNCHRAGNQGALLHTRTSTETRQHTQAGYMLTPAASSIVPACRTP